MLKRLSTCCQKEIALSFIALFFISGLNTIKAELYGGTSFIYSGKSNTTLAYKNNSAVSYSNSDAPEIYTELTTLSDKDKKKKKDDASVSFKRVLANGLLSAKAKFGKPFIGGPSQPEMNAFKSVGSDNMVAPFTGDFSYNIPLLDVGGYPINMFYSSGITMDQESSWLGLGWNINPGTITRNMRGLPDDFDGSDIVTKKQSFRPDETRGVTTGADVKLTGVPALGLALGVSGGASYNNRLGIATEAGIHSSISLGAKAGDSKTVNLSFSIGLNASSRAGASITPSVGLSLQNQEGQSGGLTGSIGVGYTYSSRMGLSAMHLDANAKVGELGSSFNSTLSFAYPSIMPSITKRLTKFSYSLNTSVGLEYWWVNPTFKLGGYYTKTYIAEEDKVTYHPSYGMLYYQKGNNNTDAILDFNRANDGIYTPASPAIAMPVYTYDVFSITGEGTGGSFRAYRGDIGHMRDARVETKEQQGALGVDLGFGNLFHGGASMSYVFTPTIVGDWTVNNGTGKTFSFDDNKEAYQAAYFKNPGEKTVPDASFQDKIANEDLVRLKLGNAGSATPIVLPNLIRFDAGKNRIGEKPLSIETRKNDRDKRTQVISFLTGEEADRIGMNTKIYSYRTYNGYENKVVLYNNCYKDGIDSFYRNHDTEHAPTEPHFLGNENIAFRKKNHISQIDVLGSDGRKYVYGLPVYNKKQVEVTFSIDPQKDKRSNSKVVYRPRSNTSDNMIGRDWILDQQEMPPYTHSYLLTALLSPNFVDLTGNGITEDDIGDGIKFNYSKYDDYKWRTPVGKDAIDSRTASYSEGLKTDQKDDKAHYIYGERESWYLYSVESKNMVARFYVKDDRFDGRAVVSDSGELDAAQNSKRGMQRLDKISLFSKADLTKNPLTAKPIKTIRFFQSYKLCINKPGPNELGSNIVFDTGKLTLDSIWITYNGNQRKPKSRYVFYYPDNTNNPDYGFDQTDRWGNYKPVLDNPSLGSNINISNQDYPYSIQDKTKADKNAAAWTMNKILLPSGAVISIDYESDSYAYVQDKKATNMMKVLGFGTSKSVLPNNADLNKLYTDYAENNHVYIQLPYPINIIGSEKDKKRAFAARYLDDTLQFYFKMAVVMPMGEGLSGIAGTENIGVYADIAGYGLISPTVAWIEVGGIGVSHTPMVQAALQFLTQQLPGKAYKGYDGSEGGNATISALAGMIDAVKALFNGDFNVLKADKKCQTVELNKTFARLTNPYRNKFGGGIRVKRIVINDNWTKMTNQLKATYGQEYKYTTTELINNKLETISSGVAAWEPSIGADENPHRKIQRYVDHNKCGPYDFGAIEMPLGEMYYPGAMVGYSRVEVLSIHRDTVKNLPTRQVTEFYTNKDFPYKSSSTALTGDAHVKYEPSKIMKILKLDLRKNVTLSQGFLIETNDMNGKEKSRATFTSLDTITPISYTQNFYNTKQVTDNTLGFNHTFPTIDSPDGVIKNALIGRDIELMTDFREHITQTISTNLDFNFDMAMFGPYPLPVTMPLTPVTKESTMYRSAAVLKIVSHFGMLDSVVVIDKGSMVSTKNLVYDAETGNPLLTRTQNEHNKPIYNFSYPAHWAYSGMGPAYKNIDAQYPGLNFEHGIITNPPSGLLTEVLESGDEIYVFSEKKDTIPGQLICDANQNTNTPWTTHKKSPDNKIWAVSTSKSGSNNPVFVFMDANGNPYNALKATIRIVRSGHKNMLDQSVGAISSLVDPRVITNTNNIIGTRLVFNQDTKIIQASAATFKDNWRVDNSFYKIDSTVDLSTYGSVKQLEIKLDISQPDYLIASNWQWQWRHNNSDSGPWYSASKKPYLYTNRWGNPHGGGGGDGPEIQYTRGFLRFDYSALPASAKLYGAFLSLYSHTDVNRNFEGPVSAYHPYLHPRSWSHSLNLTAEVNSLKGSWFPVTSPNEWGNTYLNAYSDQNVSSNTSAIQRTLFGFEDYTFRTNTGVGFIDTRIPITHIVNESKLFPLAVTKKLGIRIKDIDDNRFGNSYNGNFRCFWTQPENCALNFTNNSNLTSLLTPSGQGCNGVLPTLSYYYYQCGDTSQIANPKNDPYINRLVKCTSDSIISTFCLSKFSRKAMNPYVEGVLGNWRIDSTYAYFGERNESDPLVSIDTRIAGTIKAYKTFWNFSNNTTPSVSTYLSRNQLANDVWVWNSAITQYNRKGYEIENTDPLGRFNSGLYGYNQQLPIAVANNARVREIMFDGFEDYSYQATPNCTTCKPHRNFNFSTDISTQIVQSQKHSGMNSLQVNAGQTIHLKAPVTSKIVADKPYGLVIKPSTITYTSIGLGSGGVSGTGLNISYFNHPYAFPSNAVLEPGVNSTLVSQTTGAIGPIVSFNSSLSPGVNPEYFSVKWVGILQAPKTGDYTFRTICGDGYRIKIGTTVLSSAGAWAGTLNWINGIGGNGSETTQTIPLLANEKYQIEICFYNLSGPYVFNLKWKTPLTNGSYVDIERKYLYTPGSIHFQEPLTTNVTCNRLDSVQVTGHALTDTFSLLQTKKMLLSAWVKVGTANCCFPASYADNNSNSIIISYDGDNSVVTMKPEGSIIEGWQRYESDFEVPLNATNITVSLKNNSASEIFFDDLRIQPFNSNLKSFVYHPSNLRLMAELDENNYASFYEYDDDGTLTRVKKETVRGIKTITETKSSTQKKIINDN